MHPLVEQLEEKLLPEFEELAARIKNSFPRIRTSIDSSPTGSQTAYQGHSLFLECFLEEELEDETEEVSIGVMLGHLTTVPKIDADVSWGTPTCCREAGFREWNGIFPDEGIVVTDEIIVDLYKELPRLYEALFNAVKRGKPRYEV